MKVYKSPLTIRGDSLYCPLAFGLDSYWQCPYNCRYCYCRGLNATWGNEQRVADPDLVLNTLRSGGGKGNSSLSNAIRNRNTIRFGNKTDPFPPEERGLGVTRRILVGLKELDWSVKLETKSTDYLRSEYLNTLDSGRCIITSTVTCGLSKDWAAFESPLLPTPESRLAALREMSRLGFQVGVISEPFLPGWHTIEDWRNLLTALLDHGIQRVNVYHAHLNAFVLKRLNEVNGLDVEEVWRSNEDSEWRPVLKQIVEETRKVGIVLGCPDFVNSGPFSQQSNTCCGVDVPRPTTFNFINWKQQGQRHGGVSWDDAEATWDGVGDKDLAHKIFDGKDVEFYGWDDVGWVKTGNRWGPGEAEPDGRFF